MGKRSSGPSPIWNCIIVIPQPFLYYQYARKMKLSCQWPSISVLKSALMIRFPSKGDALIIKLLLWFCDGFTCQTVPLGYINFHDSCSHSHSPHCSTASGYVHGNSLSIPNQPILLTCKQVLDQESEVMEGGSSLIPQANSKASELEMLQKQHEEKTMKIQELKRQIESVKLRLEKRKKEIPEEKMEAFKVLSEKYNSLRDEYNALLAEKLGENE
ncbi:hypothetical protein VitviT2T_008908 [Vitis vinifera]|uniref:Uncharacterized protein n=2 Tax=Vitis vinifera TaxID=29760 RepID=A0ABY9C3M0_VITVI|nr:hypothetical protein VitviT2T_008908 [Vitis vinifera]